jgi:hypothetical protein|tara:strand:- start:2007 stop:2381 length:375 start_codon:yes stop_codon:yes gene_type:complete
MWQTLIGPVTELIGGHFKRKAAEKQATHERKLEVIKTDASWENKMADATQNSLKDEFWTLILALPLISISYGVMTDNPEVIERVRHGFQVLEELDDWYTYLLFLAISASFGLRSADKLMNLRKK